MEVEDGRDECHACGHRFPTPDEPFVLVTVSDEVDLAPPEPGAAAGAPAPDTHPTPRLYDLAEDEPDLLTDRQPVVHPPPVTTTQELPAVSPGTTGTSGPGFRFGAVSAVGALTLALAIAALPAPVVEITTDAGVPTFPTGTWQVSNLGTNLPGALMVALVALVIGVVGSAFRQRWAAGLAGGAGLAITGWAALVWGLAERPITVAVEATRVPTTEEFTVTLTRDVGFWLILVAGVLGLLTFLVSLGRVGNDRRRGLNPWIAALGACAAVIAAAGPLLPEGTAQLSDNWTASDGAGRPLAYLVGRLVQLGLLAYAGVVGFLLVRRYGLGLAIGGMTVSVWLALTTLLDIGVGHVGPGATNPGDDAGAIDLHSVTIVGMIALVGLAMVAVIAAYDQAAREYQA